MRVATRRPKQPVTWIPQVLETLKHKGRLTSQELAAIIDKTFGSDAVTRCRQLGLPLEAVAFVNGSRLPRKLYALDTHLLWLALEEAVTQINRYARILNSRDQTADCRTFRTPALWIQHVHRLRKSTQKTPGRNRTLIAKSNNGHLHKTRPAGHD